MGAAQSESAISVWLAKQEIAHSFPTYSSHFNAIDGNELVADENHARSCSRRASDNFSDAFRTVAINGNSNANPALSGANASISASSQ